jgi:phage terminase large subunit GpA-like protein
MRPAEELGDAWSDAVAAVEICATVTEWADRYRFLPRNASAEPGPWRTERTPYLRAIQDCLSVTDPAWKVVIMASNQVGKSEAAHNLVCYRIHQFPCPILWIVPRDKDVEGYVSTRLDPMFAATPEVGQLVGSDETGAEAADNAVLKRFPGGQLEIAGAKSPAVFRQRPVEVVVLDDLDAHGDNSEGDVVDLASKRTVTFRERARKVVCISTPTISGASRIAREYAGSSMRRYHVPCPRCGAFQVLRWERLVYDAEAPQHVSYCCEHCGQHIEQHERDEMVAAGEWRAERPALVGQVEGWAISALYSPWRTWTEIVQAWIAAQRALRDQHDESKLQTFYNLELGEPFVPSSQRRLNDHELQILRRREPPFERAALPIDVVTAGVDVQGNRLEASFWGWGRSLECWLLEHVVLKGAVEEDSVWTELQRVLVGHQTRGACVDAGSNSARVKDQVTRLLRPLAREKCAIWPVKGQAGHRQLWPRPIRPGTLVVVGVDDGKDGLFDALDHVTMPGPGYVHLPTTVDAAWLNQLFSERKSLLSDRTKARYVKVDGRRRNEALECAVYARAALYGVLALDRELQVRLVGDRRDATAAAPAQSSAAAPARVPPGPAGPAGPRPRRESWIRR